MSDWQPIATAPDDGTIIHVWADGYEWPEAVMYEDYPPAEADEIGERGYWRYADDLLAEATDSAGQEDWTHWRYLPTTPIQHEEITVSETITLGRLEGLAEVAKRAARRNWSDDDMQAFNDAFTPEVCVQLVAMLTAREGKGQ